METLTDRLKRSQKELLEQGAELWGQTREAGKGFATFVQGEARDWSTYLRERASEVKLEDVKTGALGLFGKVTGRPITAAETATGEAEAKEEPAPEEQSEGAEA